MAPVLPKTLVRATLLVLALDILSCSRVAEPREQFRIVVVQSDFSMANAREVVLTDSLIEVSSIGGLVGEGRQVLWSQTISGRVADSLLSFLKNEKLDTLQRAYSDGLTADGMQYSFEFGFRGQARRVQLGNMWLPQLRSLTEVVNSGLPDSLRLSLDLPRPYGAP